MPISEEQRAAFFLRKTSISYYGPGCLHARLRRPEDPRELAALLRDLLVESEGLEGQELEKALQKILDHEGIPPQRSYSETDPRPGKMYNHPDWNEVLKGPPEP